MEYKYDFSWGDTRGIREIMLRHAGFLKLSSMPWDTFGYPPHEGVPELRGNINKLILSLTGKKYKHVLVTNGATNALNAYAYAMKVQGSQIMQTHKLYFSRYPGIALNNGYEHARVEVVKPAIGDIGIIDSPSNPRGLVLGGGGENVIWDAAYYSPTYCGIYDGTNLKCHPVVPYHNAMAGSLNKLSGVNGIRIGWLATDSDFIFQRALEYITSNLCGVSQPSQFAANQILTKVDMNRFYAEAKALIDTNKTELSKLNYLFGNQEIPTHGMFVLFESDQKLKELFEKASLKVMPGSQCGDDRDSVRFNLANSVRDTAEMVRAVLKVDGK